MEPEWSPDGKHIIFALYHNEGSNIFTINVDGTSLEQVTFDDATVNFPSWRP
jgi:Tol biopolymer transport system component